MAGTEVAGEGNFTIEDGDENDPPIVFEGWYSGYQGYVTILHRGRRPVVLKDIGGIRYMADCTHGTPGDVYISDFVGHNMTFCKGQKVWARQLNLENTVTDLVATDKGTNVWILGFKTEKGQGGLLNSTNGASVEVLGHFAYSTERPAELLIPYLSVTNGGSLSASMREYTFDCVSTPRTRLQVPAVHAWHCVPRYPLVLYTCTSPRCATFSFAESRLDTVLRVAHIPQREHR